MTARRGELEVRTADGVARAWTYREGDGPRAAVLLYPDAFGVRATMQGMAERMARMGHLVLLPDVFYRSGEVPPFDIPTVWSTPAERQRLTALIGTLTAERVGSDASAWLDAIAAQPGVRPDRVGVVGYCMGGRMAFLTAALHPGRVRAAASFHGGGLATDKPDSPHLLAPRVKASLYLAAADQDRGCTPEQQGTLAAALGAASVRYCLELYPGKKHGFAVPDNAGAHDPEAADRHWRRLEWFFGEALG